MPLPRMAKVRQKFPRPRIEDIEATVREQCERGEIAQSLSPGMSVAITAGSRGISGISKVIRSLVAVVREAGAEPFIVPAMGSHGGATAEGQEQLLAGFGVTQEGCGAPVVSSMEVVELGETESGVTVYMDRMAAEADGVILAGRIKPHTDFHADYESGLMKMASIGLGKHAQALALHAHGVTGIRDYMIEAADSVLGSGKILFGVGIVENAYEEPAFIEAIPAAQIPGRERELLTEAARLMPKLPVEDLDILLVDEMGKDFSGTGMDTNVLGRFKILGVEEPESPRIKYVIVGDLSERSHGNALGAGLADFTTVRLTDKIDARVTNENVLTSTFVERAKIPMALENDQAALEAALRCTWGVPSEEARLARIPNTLELEFVYLSENLLSELDSGVEVMGEPEELSFDANGDLGGFSGPSGEARTSSTEALPGSDDGYHDGH